MAQSDKVVVIAIPKGIINVIRGQSCNELIMSKVAWNVGEASLSLRTNDDQTTGEVHRETQTAAPGSILFWWNPV